MGRAKVEEYEVPDEVPDEVRRILIAIQWQGRSNIRAEEVERAFH